MIDQLKKIRDNIGDFDIDAETERAILKLCDAIEEQRESITAMRNIEVHKRMMPEIEIIANQSIARTDKILEGIT